MSGILFDMAVPGFHLGTLTFMVKSIQLHTVRHLQSCHFSVIIQLMYFNIYGAMTQSTDADSVKLTITHTICLFADDTAFCYYMDIRSGTQLCCYGRQQITNTFVQLFPAELVCLAAWYTYNKLPKFELMLHQLILYKIIFTNKFCKVMNSCANFRFPTLFTFQQA